MNQDQVMQELKKNGILSQPVTTDNGRSLKLFNKYKEWIGMFPMDQRNGGWSQSAFKQLLPGWLKKAENAGTGSYGVDYSNTAASYFQPFN